MSDPKQVKQKESRRFLTLNLALTGLVFVILLLTMIITFGVVVLLIQQDVLSVGGTQLDVRRLLRYLGLVSIILGSLLSFLLGRLPMKSVKQVIHAMNRLAAGDFRTRLQLGPWISRLPDVQNMVASFNTMAEEMENTELLREDFVNNFSHEFKTPIVSISGFASLLRRGNLPPAQQEEYLTVIEEESMRLATMATNVLNLTKVENQSILSGTRRFNLSEQIRSCVLLMESRWTAKKLNMDIDFQEYYIQANEELLKEVWLNLIDNAVKFTPENGDVRIRMEAVEDLISVQITNTGSEIPARSLDRIFQKFYQADESHSAQGNGVGLAIVKKVVELHQGTVSVLSRNEITTFTVNLPISREDGE